MFFKYVIKSGEDLDQIASNFNTSSDVLRNINNIMFDDYITSGREIIVPGTNNKYFTTYTIKKGDNLYKIAKEYNINPELLASMNGLNYNDYIYPDQVILIPKGNYSYYITKEGDTLKSVANTFSSDIPYLLTDNETIYLLPGQIIVKNKEMKNYL